MTRSTRTLPVGPFLLLMLIAALALPSAAGAAEPGTGGIAGTVTAKSDGRGLEEIEVCAYWDEPGEFVEGCTLSDANGTYEITGLVPGQYVVSYWVYGGGSRLYHEAKSWATATPVDVTSDHVVRGIDEALEVEAPAEENASISGTVTVAATGAPVVKAVVCAIRRGGGGNIKCVSTDGAGRYSIVGLSAGEWDVFFTAEGLDLGLLPQSWDDRSEPEKPDPVVLGGNTHAEGIDAALLSGGGITGTVRAAATGAPLGEILVCLIEVSGGTPECVETASSGAYSFEDVPTGIFKVAFSPEGEEIWGSLVREAEEETGEQLFPRDGWPTQWWNGQATIAAATPISVTAPQTVTGIDGLLGTTPAGPEPGGSGSPGSSGTGPHAAAPPQTFIPTVPTPKRCKPGFVRKQGKRQVVCVKRHKSRRHHKHPKPRKHAKQSR